VITHISLDDVEIEFNGVLSCRKAYLTSNDVATGFYKIELIEEESSR